jgi:hypothetical protein
MLRRKERSLMLRRKERSLMLRRKERSLMLRRKERSLMLRREKRSLMFRAKSALKKRNGTNACWVGGGENWLKRSMEGSRIDMGCMMVGIVLEKKQKAFN